MSVYIVYSSLEKMNINISFYKIKFPLKKKDRGCRDCSGSQKVGARKIARCQFRSQLKILQGANFFEPKLWMIACTTTSFMFSFMYKWSGFVCTNVNVGIVLLFFISISSSKTKRFI
jgi:hypothetical protein